MFSNILLLVYKTFVGFSLSVLTLKDMKLTAYRNHVFYKTLNKLASGGGLSGPLVSLVRVILYILQLSNKNVLQNWCYVSLILTISR